MDLKRILKFKENINVLTNEELIRLEAQQVLDELLETLEMVQAFKIPSKLKRALNKRLEELSTFSYTPMSENYVDIIPFMDWFCNMYDVRKGVSKTTTEENLEKDIKLYKSRTNDQWNRYFKEESKK